MQLRRGREGPRGSVRVRVPKGSVSLAGPPPATRPTGARSPRAAPALAAQPKIAALDRLRRFRAALKAGVRAHVTIPIPPAVVEDLIRAEPPYLCHADRDDKRKVAAAFRRYWADEYGV